MNEMVILLLSSVSFLVTRDSENKDVLSLPFDMSLINLLITVVTIDRKNETQETKGWKE